MMYATKIKMKPGSFYANNLLKIDQIYIVEAKNEGFYLKADVYQAVKLNPGCIKVNIPPYPDLIAAISVNGEKYVKSAPDMLYGDNLLCLPRE